jgi:hypothetical protein
MDKKPQKPLGKNAINQELLQSILDFEAKEAETNIKLVKALVEGENSPLIANFNPKNHLAQLHQKKKNLGK